MTDDARQDRAGAHVAAGEPDAREEERRARGRGREADIGRHREDRARAGAHAVDGRDDRLRAGAHGLDQVAGHAREGEQAVHRHLRERRDDLVHVAAGAEIAACAGEDDRLDVRRIAETAEQVAELRVRLEGERILPLRPVERDDAYASLETPAEMPWLEIGVAHTRRSLAVRRVRPRDPSRHLGLEHTEQLDELIALPR